MKQKKRYISASSVIVGVAGGVILGLLFHFPSALEALQLSRPVRLIPTYLILGALLGGVWGLSRASRTRWRS